MVAACWAHLSPWRRRFTGSGCGRSQISTVRCCLQGNANQVLSMKDRSYILRSRNFGAKNASRVRPSYAAFELIILGNATGSNWPSLALRFCRWSASSDEFEGAVHVFGNRRAAFHPVARVDVADTVDIRLHCMVNMTADHPSTLLRRASSATTRELTMKFTACFTCSFAQAEKTNMAGQCGGARLQ